MRRTVVAILATVALVAGAVPAGADPPTQQRLAFDFPDFENGLVVIINTDRAAICTPEQVAFEEWLIDLFAFFDFLDFLDQGGNPDDFPIQPPPEDPGPPPPEPGERVGFDELRVKFKETGKGAAVASAIGSDLHIELWEMNENPPMVGPCTDTSEATGAWATGTTTYHGNDNDLFGSETRGNAFGDRGSASLTDGEGGEWTYDWRFHVNSKCHAPEFGPPACLMEVTTLTPQ